MTIRRGCPVCGRTIRYPSFLCRTHWYTVSQETRDLVWALFRRENGSGRHLAAVTQAVREAKEATTVFGVLVPSPSSAGGTTCFGEQATIVGTNGPDSLEGTSGHDVIVGLAGIDFLYGFGTGDSLCGGADADFVHGGLGSDKVTGGDGSDTVIGDFGNDEVVGSTGADDLYDGYGADELDGGGGVNDTWWRCADDTTDTEVGVELITSPDEDWC